ncbi:site-specific integrase [Vibrio breoganii]
MKTIISSHKKLSEISSQSNENLAKSHKNYALINLANQSLNFSSKVEPCLHTPVVICIQWYINTNRKYKKSYCSEKYRLRTLSKHFGNLPLRAITTDENAPTLIQDFINVRLTEVHHGTARKDATTLQCMLNHLRKDVGLQIPNVFEKVRLPKDSGIRKFVPSDEQVYRVIGNIVDTDLRDAAILLAETGCRRGEIMKLTVGDVHCDKKYILCRNTKNGEDRKVPLSPSAIAILSRILINLVGRSDTYKLFRMRPERLSKEFRKAADKEGLSEFVVHSLRHYRLSKFIANGHDAMLVSKVSGHRDHRALNRYVKIDAEDLANILF